ncbi:hypothetical protein D3C72_1486670 [compost metagenome]
MLVLDQGDALQPAADRHLLLVEDHLLGRRGDPHQARGALSIQTHAGNGGGQARRQGHLTRHIGPGRALLQGRAHDDVLDLGRIDASARDGVLHGMSAELLRLGVVEGPAIGPTNRGAGGGDDDGFTHREVLSFLGRYRSRRGRSLLERARGRYRGDADARCGKRVSCLTERG